MLQAVQIVHDEKIVHSDLKPANFVLVKGQLKLIDFGIANAIQDAFIVALSNSAIEITAALAVMGIIGFLGIQPGATRMFVTPGTPLSI